MKFKLILILSWLIFMTSAVSAGVSCTDWNNNHLHKAPGLMLRAQSLLHLPQMMGLGFGFTLNINRKGLYASVGIMAAVGAWNW